MNKETVTASEIADWVYCPEAFRLAQLGLPSANRPARDSGDRRHAHKATMERVAAMSIAIGRVLIAIALLGLAVLWALGR